MIVSRHFHAHRRGRPAFTVRSGLKADLQHRLYSEIVRAAAEEAMGDHGYYNLFGSDSSDSPMDDGE